jgi:hypothetical protein
MAKRNARASGRAGARWPDVARQRERVRRPEARPVCGRFPV